MFSARISSTLLAFVLWPLLGSSADLSSIDRKLVREPHYQTKPRYALAVFGPDAQFKMWLVLDGNVLYADKTGNGDLAEAGKKFAAEKEQYFRGSVFKVGDVSVGGQRYTNLEVRTETLKEWSVTYSDWSAFQNLISAHPDALGYSVAVDVPLPHALPDGKGGQLTRLRHYVALADANGFLQFADRPEKAPVIHFGGPWSIWPREGQKLVLGRPDEFTAVIGTPGLGPGTLALIQYHTLEDKPSIFVPKDARPALELHFPDKEGKQVASHIVLENRC
jgi:hypothetical protein